LQKIPPLGTRFIPHRVQIHHPASHQLLSAEIL
jgi:hypothetical protein